MDVAVGAGMEAKLWSGALVKLSELIVMWSCFDVDGRGIPLEGEKNNRILKNWIFQGEEQSI